MYVLACWKKEHTVEIKWKFLIFEEECCFHEITSRVKSKRACFFLIAHIWVPGVPSEMLFYPSHKLCPSRGWSTAKEESVVQYLSQSQWLILQLPRYQCNFLLRENKSELYSAPKAVGSLPVIYHKSGVNFSFSHQNHTHSGSLSFPDEEDVCKCVSAESQLILDCPRQHFLSGGQGTFLSSPLREQAGHYMVSCQKRLSSPTSLPLSTAVSTYFSK